MVAHDLDVPNSHISLSIGADIDVIGYLPNKRSGVDSFKARSSFLRDPRCTFPSESPDDFKSLLHSFVN